MTTLNTGNVRAADSFGRTFDRPRMLITDVNLLDPGHHVACGRFPNTVYEYHAIVDRVDYFNNIVHLIGLCKRPRFGRIGNRCVEQYQLEFTEVMFYIVIYTPDEELSEEDTVNRARSQIGCEFNFRSSNSFATSCKLMPHRETSPQCDGPDREKKITYGAGAAPLALGGAGTIALTTAEAAAEGGITAGAAAISSVKVIAPLAVVGGIVEVASASYHTHKAHKLKKEGRITQRQYDDAVATRWINAVTSTAGPVGGAVGGAAIGAAITGPAAPVGAIIGGIIGGVVGLVGGLGAGVGLSAAGRATRDKLQKREEDQRILEEIRRGSPPDEELEEQFYQARLGFTILSEEDNSANSDTEIDVSSMEEIDLQMRQAPY